MNENEINLYFKNTVTKSQHFLQPITFNDSDEMHDLSSNHIHYFYVTKKKNVSHLKTE